MLTVIITLDLDCCRWREEIEKIICCFQARTEFVFEKVEYEKDKVILSGNFDPDKLCCMLRGCKAGCLIKKIEVVEPDCKPKFETSSCKLIPHPCPNPCLQPACPTPRPCHQGHCRPVEESACRCPSQKACRCCRRCCRDTPCPPVVIIIQDRPVLPCVIM
ncbi:protein PYRICULARIA ORYZAE RESISTANCE 21-like [Panicum virgatum]|uniref:Uncharacterized protein n=1 Tax=Panicum virgatum TaxID=38727 RepID=A0A8T0PSI0_PANVG|nr:protein PYRICULARIA ORYZAE RESISTANCE 21-like [Panicum virgatum]KAG2564962.1 hypothetical protein PVAP13_7NG013000 [Panicum virgatum]KAG2564963.1 hypothetical protein PVAP13_7NG013000 [Panicum virgatum]